MENFKNMSFEAKKLALKQCIEGGYTFNKGVNPISNLIYGLENDPDWFNFTVDKNDYKMLAEIYAEVLAPYAFYTGDINDTVYEILSGESTTETIKKLLISTYEEGLSCDEEDIQTILEDAIKKLTYGFDTNDYIEVDCTDIEDFLENAEFGQKAEIEGKTYYKVRNHVDGEPYAVYFNDNEEMEVI